MPDRICEHYYPPGIVNCQHCGTHESRRGDQSCIWRDAPPRPVPESVFAKPWEIGDRLRAIRLEEGRDRPGSVQGAAS